MAEGRLELAAFIEGLRSEFQTAIKKGEGKDLRFEVEDIEIELSFAATHEVSGETGGEGRLKLVVFEWGAGGKITGKDESIATQRLKMKLKPVFDGKDEEPRLSG